MSFREEVYALVTQIPSGRVSTYGDVAAALGSPRAARQVGFALARLDRVRAEQVPCLRMSSHSSSTMGQESKPCRGLTD